MKYLVLGSAGQIGAPLCKFLKKKGHQVIEVDIVNDDIHQDLRTAAEPGDYKNWPYRIEEADFVFFLAFDVGGARYLDKYQHTTDFIQNNVKIMSNVFPFLQHYKKPFVFASSQMSNMTNSPYGVAKLLGETYTKSLGGLTVKFWNIYGPEHDLEKSHVITDLILMARDKKEIVLRTTGQEERQFVHVEDCCECLYEVSQNYNTIPRDKNLHVASFDWVKIEDVAKIIHKEMNLKGEIQMSSSKDLQVGFRNEPDPYIIKYWRPYVSLENGIADMVGHYTVKQGKNVKLLGK
ncbi:MAG: NAD(P)-dependent oxidoreductase [Candidatus Paceibacterota bacterium]|jgi:nucleoside-diphosphate-sugar epimerase